MSQPWRPHRKPRGPWAKERKKRNYERYLHSIAWLKLRQKIMVRSQGFCERPDCRRPAHDVHHLTYDRFGHEALEDLQAICRRCHDRLHHDKALLHQHTQPTAEHLAVVQKAHAAYQAYRAKILLAYECPKCHQHASTTLHGVKRCIRCGQPMTSSKPTIRPAGNRHPQIPK